MDRHGKKPLTAEQIAALNSGPALIQELAQAFISQDDVAALIAGVNTVGKFLETQDRIATALERLAGCVDRYDATSFTVVSKA